MIQKTINLYTIDELKTASETGYIRAIEKMRNSNEYYFLSESMQEYVIDLLDEYKIKWDGESDINVQYSLGYCQGDGAMFTGLVTYNYKGKDYLINIKHSGHYYHHNSKDFHTTDLEGGTVDEWEEVEVSFNDVYKDICKKLERWGYNFIESADSEESIIDNCNANGYTFTINGDMENI